MTRKQRNKLEARQAVTKAAASAPLKSSSGTTTYGSNYSSNYRKLSPFWYSPRILNCSLDPYSFLNPSERTRINELSLDLFRSSPLINSAIVRKNQWAAATKWYPEFRGVDKDWGKLAVQYLVEEAYATCNTAGPNYTWNRTLLAIANQLDIAGDVLIVFVPYATGTRVSLYPSSLVGQRDNSQTIVGGTYDGREIDNGVIFDATNYPIAYNILQQNPTDDFSYNVRKANLIFEPNEFCRRGISSMTAPLISILDYQDIASWNNRSVKNDSQLPVVINTESGTGEDYAFDGPGEVDNTTNTDANAQPTPPTIIDFGDRLFMRAGAGESITVPASDRPSVNGVEWLRHVGEEIISSVGWEFGLLHPSQLQGSVSGKTIEAQVQQTIIVRQETLRLFVKQFTAMNIARAMASGRLPQPKTASDWNKWSWSKPAEFCMDSYYADQSNLMGLKVGSKTLQEVVARDGGNWEEVTEQIDIENRRRIDKAKGLVAYSSGSLEFERALDMTGNAGNVAAAPIQQQIVPKEV